MKIRIETTVEGYRNDIGDVVRLFYGEHAIADAGQEDATLFHEQVTAGGRFEERICFVYQNREKTQVLTGDSSDDELELKRRQKRLIKQACYSILKEISGRKPAWGSLTGIRPTRLYYRALEENRTVCETEAKLAGEYDLSPEKVKLLSEVVAAQQPYYHPDADQFDLYVGIPFCTTRCTYCSFSSGVIGDGKLVEPYLRSLEREIDACAGMMREQGLSVSVGYMGGGTPSSLSTRQMDRLLTYIEKRFPALTEWTIEAGRPDTLDKEKLSMLKAHPVTRISINPQTMNDETLRRIGRAHTTEDTLAAYETARECGFDNINMDLITALPGETEEMFLGTLEAVRRLAPDSLTVHTLAIKRSSKLHEQGYKQQESSAGRMVEAGRQCAHDMGMKAYYLYRQKYMAANLENVGYALPGKVCRYNIDNMEEITSVLAVGAGSISKRLLKKDERILRVPNVSNILQYIERTDEMIERKKQMFGMACRQ